jgi:putative membrane protein insertion efficiency factor
MKKLILALIKVYQKTFSPDHGLIFSGGATRCRYFPSCSQYTYEAIVHYGVVRGLLKGFWRVLRCNPFSKGGVDLVNK